MQVNNSGREYLTSPISIDEVKSALLFIEDARSPRPNGFSSKFYKLHWDLLHQDIMDTVLEIFHTKQLLKGLNHNFIALIPKKYKPQKICDYNPIACANVLHKKNSKILLHRIKKIRYFLIAQKSILFNTR